MIGLLLGNRYEILEQLGGGGMAVVYKGKDTLLDRLVTIKVLRPAYAADEQFLMRFRREAQAVARLSHPNIVSIYDVGFDGGYHYLVMEYVDGEDLKSILRRQGRMVPQVAARIVADVAQALQHAHENNIVHRDIKPHNILITRQGRAKLTDFGIARETDGGVTVTQSDSILGSVHYLSPEQAEGRLAGPASDIYSLGVVLYELITGRVPFTGESPIAVAIKHISTPPPPLEVPEGQVSGLLQRIVGRCLQKDPDLRYQKAGELLEDLHSFLADPSAPGAAADPEEATVVLPRPAPAGKQRAGRRRWVWGLLLIILLLGTGLWWGYQRIFLVPEVIMPRLVGLSLAQARAQLADKGLRAEVREQFSNTVQQGYVMEQDVEPGTPVKKNRVVLLTVSRGPESIKVPDLYRQNLQEARITLAEAGLELGETRYAFDNLVEEGRIIGQEPRAGTTALKGDRVTVYLSKGPEKAAVNLPDLRGMFLEQAKSTLVAQGLQVADVQQEESSDYLAGQVIRHTPPAGSKLSAGDSVQLVVSTGPGPAPREAVVSVSHIPNDGQLHEVRIVVDDLRGTTNAFVDTVAGGHKLEKTVKYWGKATVRVYVDGKQVAQQPLP